MIARVRPTDARRVARNAWRNQSDANAPHRRQCGENRKITRRSQLINTSSLSRRMMPSHHTHQIAEAVKRQTDRSGRSIRVGVRLPSGPIGAARLRCPCANTRRRCRNAIRRRAGDGSLPSHRAPRLDGGGVAVTAKDSTVQGCDHSSVDIDGAELDVTVDAEVEG